MTTTNNSSRTQLQKIAPSSTSSSLSPESQKLFDHSLYFASGDDRQQIADYVLSQNLQRLIILKMLAKHALITSVHIIYESKKIAEIQQKSSSNSNNFAFEENAAMKLEKQRLLVEIDCFMDDGWQITGTPAITNDPNSEVLLKEEIARITYRHCWRPIRLYRLQSPPTFKLNAAAALLNEKTILNNMNYFPSALNFNTNSAYLLPKTALHKKTKGAVIREIRRKILKDVKSDSILGHMMVRILQKFEHYVLQLFSQQQQSQKISMNGLLFQKLSVLILVYNCLVFEFFPFGTHKKSLLLSCSMLVNSHPLRHKYAPMPVQHEFNRLLTEIVHILPFDFTTETKKVSQQPLRNGQKNKTIAKDVQAIFFKYIKHNLSCVMNSIIMNVTANDCSGNANNALFDNPSSAIFFQSMFDIFLLKMYIFCTYVCLYCKLYTAYSLYVCILKNIEFCIALETATKHNFFFLYFHRHCIFQSIFIF